MEAQQKTVSHALGEIVWLLSSSPIYKQLHISDLEWMVMPPMLLNQFRIFKDGKQPIGFALWAYLSVEVETRMLQENKNGEEFRLKPEEWKSGDRLWLIELVSPYHSEKNKLNEQLVADLVKNIFKENKFKFIRNA
ncbi:MAG: toxin-activating lysine-acyltransferase [Alphaproteobacteria bacterium]|nr:toxin-activating lysine-acyltransferase [Alphaproteobacteria bacterium]